MTTINRRRRATAIIHGDEGILLVKMRHLSAMLPGGGIREDETEQEAVLREVAEELGVVADSAQFLFEYEAMANHHYVFLVALNDPPTPCHEIDGIEYHGVTTMVVSAETKAIIERFESAQF